MARRSYPVLDALRGVAALSVLLFHATGLVRWVHDPGAPAPASHGYLAVDFFYMLSGFVVAHAYGGRLAAGWPGRAFLAARVRRLYPTAALGLLLGLGVSLAMQAVHGTLTPAALALAALQATPGLLLVPLLGPQGGDAFPFDGPLWSLSQELGVNAVFGCLGRRLTALGLAAACALGALACVGLLAASGRLEAGTAPRDFVLGLARIAYAFPLGVLVQRAHARGLTRRLAGRRGGALAAALLLLLACPSWPGSCAAVDGACVFLAFPLILACAAEARAPAGWGGRAAALSYPLYATHMALRPLWLDVLPALDPLAGLLLMLAASLGLAEGARRLLQPARGRARSERDQVVPA